MGSAAREAGMLMVRRATLRLDGSSHPSKAARTLTRRPVVAVSASPKT